MSVSPRSDRLDDRGELRRIVLAVAVDADSEVEVVLERVAEAGLHGAADAEVERQAQHPRAGCARDLGGAVVRAVVDHEDLELRVVRAELRHRRTRSFPPR